MSDYVIDAKNQTLGRLASRLAYLLQGKNRPDYNPRKVGGSRIVIKNAHLIKLSGRKASQKVYYRHSGRPGKLKRISYRDMLAKDPKWVIRHAVRGMLPANRLRAKRLKLLVFE
jgi:large subunit ribosomal protein L13